MDVLLFKKSRDLQTKVEQANSSPNASTIAGLVTDMATLADQKATIWATYKAGMASAVPTVLALNATAPQTEIWQANERAVNAFELQNLVGTAFSSADSVALLAIASQCPLIGGDAVFRARVLYGQLAEFSIEDFDICAEASSHEGKKQASLEDIEIFPNPVTDRVYIKTHGKELQVKVLDNLGQAVISAQAVSPQGIDIAGLDSGIYRLMLVFPDGTLVIKSIAISR
mgnify:CR=1 FL=1